MRRSPEFDIESFDRAAASLLGLIRGEKYASASAAEQRMRAETRLSRIRVMLEALGDPQHSYPVVHVTGTSGKGSTAAAVASILTAAGYRVGLRTSPYVQVPTEKLQIGSSLIDASSFAVMVTRVLDRAACFFPRILPGPPVSYGEIWSILGYWWFAERAVDIAVVEVGAGGRFDATNVIDPIVSVITSVGLDHVLTLGPTIADIAWHKAGIIKPGATAVVGDLPAEARSVVVAEARYASVDVVESRARDNPAVHQRTVAFGFQERNAELATAVAMVLARRGFAITPAAINAGIGSARLPGRFEQMRGADHPPVWLDGAHNQDKIVALATEVKKLFTGGPLPVIVVGMLSSKDPTRLLAPLRSAASSLVLTEPAVIGRNSLAVGMLADSVAASGFTGPVHTEPNPDAAMQLAEEIARCEGAAVLVTGSMYLVGQVRRRWYRDRDVVLQRTPWPLANSDS